MRPQCEECENMKESFILYTAHYGAIKTMTIEQKGELLDALFAYAEDETEPETDDAFVKMAFAFMRSSLDKNREKYETKQSRMKELAERRWSKRLGRETVAEADGEQGTDGEAPETEDGEADEGCARNATAMRRMRTQCGRNAKGTHAMLNVNDNVNVNASNINVTSNNNYKEISDDISMSNSENPNVDGGGKGGAEDTEEDGRARKTVRLDYNAVMKYWNAEADRTGSPMRRITRMTEVRKGALRARVKENGGDVAVVYKAIDMAMVSARMNGGNKDGWIANYDWMMSPKNFQRVLEGTYTDPKNLRRAPEPEPAPSLPPKTKEETERELAERERQERAEKAAKRKRDIERMRSYMEGALKSPRGTMAKIVHTAAQTGRLEELGLMDEWREMNENR